MDHKGRVKFFSADKGYGFIVPEAGMWLVPKKETS
jgi:cold shock CspA family protein